MTDSYPSPTWADIDAFCGVDGWSELRDTDHVFWERVLASGEVLQTHRSLAAKKEIKPRIFSAILREQLKVTKAEFWNAIRTGRPVERPVELEEAPVTYPAWVVFGLAKFGYSEAQIQEMTPDEAQDLLQRKWAGL